MVMTRPAKPQATPTTTSRARHREAEVDARAVAPDAGDRARPARPRRAWAPTSASAIAHAEDVSAARERVGQQRGRQQEHRFDEEVGAEPPPVRRAGRVRGAERAVARRRAPPGRGRGRGSRRPGIPHGVMADASGTAAGGAARGSPSGGVTAVADGSTGPPPRLRTPRRAARWRRRPRRARPWRSVPRRAAVGGGRRAAAARPGAAGAAGLPAARRPQVGGGACGGQASGANGVSAARGLRRRGRLDLRAAALVLACARVLRARHGFDATGRSRRRARRHRPMRRMPHDRGQRGGCRAVRAARRDHHPSARADGAAAPHHQHRLAQGRRVAARVGAVDDQVGRVARAQRRAAQPLPRRPARRADGVGVARGVQRERPRRRSGRARATRPRRCPRTPAPPPRPPAARRRARRACSARMCAA